MDTASTMDFSGKTLIEILGLLVWLCISQPIKSKNLLFGVVFFSQEVLSEIITAASLIFAPGLLEVLQAATPPTIDFFKRLPAKTKRHWGVYAVVMEKNGARPRVYIGSGTNALNGVQHRWYQYNPDSTSFNPPTYVRQALLEGYKITHKGLLVWCPFPAAADVPESRLLFIAIEATLSLFFWAMHSKTKDYMMGACCHWSRESFTYDGLCGHNALIEGVLGEFDLTREQRETLAAAAKVGRQKRNRLNAAEQRKRNPEKRSAAVKVSQQKGLASMKHRCKLCNLNFPVAAKLVAHNRSERHKKKAARAAAGVVDRWRCKPCGMSWDNRQAAQMHKKHKVHLKTMAALAKAGKEVDDETDDEVGMETDDDEETPESSMSCDSA